MLLLLLLLLLSGCAARGGACGRAERRVPVYDEIEVDLVYDEIGRGCGRGRAYLYEAGRVNGRVLYVGGVGGHLVLVELLHELSRVGSFAAGAFVFCVCKMKQNF